MNTHDIELPPLPRPKVPLIDADVDLMDIGRLANWCEKTAKDYARAAIEADRKRRREPTAAEISNVVREITGCPDIKSGEKSLVVALGMLFHSCAAPQPAERSGAPTPHNADSGAQNGIQATQPAELVERPLPPLDNLSIAELRELAMRDCSQYSDDDLAIAWELFDRLVEGGRIVDATEPVKRKRRYAQGTALGEFGIIPMCDQVDDDPVEGARVATDPSLPELSIVWHDSPEGVDRAMWEEAAQDAGLSYEDLRDSVSVGQDENGAPVELTHAQTIDAIRNQGCWGFVDANTGTIHAWAADDADPMLVVHMLAHEIGHMTGEQHPDELQEEMRAEQFGRVAAMAFRMWRQRWPLTIVEGAQ